MFLQGRWKSRDGAGGLLTKIEGKKKEALSRPRERKGSQNPSL